MEDQQKLNFSKPVAIMILVIIIGVLLVVIIHQPENNQLENMQQEQSEVSYNNTEFNFSLVLPNSWYYQESPEFIDGAMVYNGRHIDFKSADERTTLRLSIEDNFDQYTSAKVYVSNLLKENEQQFDAGDIPYKLKYQSEDEVAYNHTVGYILRGVFNPSGITDSIYIVTNNTIFIFSYSELTDEYTDNVTSALREKIEIILNTFIIYDHSEIITANFSSPNLDYSIYVPDDWHISSLSEGYEEFNDSMNDEDYISNEKVGAPLAMSDQGVWISISRDAKEDKTLEEFVDQQSREKQVKDRFGFSLNKYPAIRQQEIPLVATESGYDVIIYIDTGDFFYSLSVLTGEPSVYFANEEQIDYIINSFEKQ